jgi:methionyl-tRNA formyltransferase
VEKKMLKVVLLGYGELAQSVLLGIMQSKHKIIGVMRWERDRPNKLLAFIRDSFAPDGLTSLIKANNLYEIKANKANSKAFVKEMQRLKPDVIIVGAWGEILKADAIKLPKVACINCHPSLLPKHRGSNPYISTIKMGEVKTGVTFHLVNEGIDTGEILAQQEVLISETDTGGSLRDKCAYTAKGMVAELLDKLEKAELIPEKQNNEEATYFSKVQPHDFIIRWNLTAQEIHNNIRSMLPWIKSYTLHNNTFLFIKHTKIVDIKIPYNTPGVILNKKKGNLLISTGEPDKAIFAGDIEAYGLMSNLWSKAYVDNIIQVGDYLQ